MTTPSFDAHQAQPQEASGLRPIVGLGTAAVMLIGLVTLINTLVVYLSWGSVDQAGQYANHVPGVTLAVVDSALSQYGMYSTTETVVGALAAILFLLWLWRARVNAETIGGPDSQRRHRDWTFWGWLCPIVFFWFPYQIVVDVYRASARKPVRTTLVGWWWAVFLAEGLVTEVGTRLVSTDDPVNALRDYAFLYTDALVLGAAATFLIARIVKHIGVWQFPESAPANRRRGLLG